MKVPFLSLSAQYNRIKNEIDAAVKGVIEDTAFIGGKYVEKFEQEFAVATGLKHVISCANGTDSLYIIMKMLGIGPGDEVITPANSWISSAETISQTGAMPLFIDVDPGYFTLNEEVLEGIITSRTRAIIAVHLFGQACNMDVIQTVCDRHGLFLIEDCAQSHLTEYHGRLTGSMGHAASFSFYPGKNLGAYGDAGCMATNDDQLAAKLKMFARHGALVKHEHVMEGINSRMDGIQAAILSAKLPHLNEWTKERIHHSEKYRQHLQDIDEIVLPAIRPDSRHTFHLYVIRSRRRKELINHLRKKEIETSIHYPRILPNLPAYRYLNCKPGDFPVANKLEEEILSLPMFPELTEEMIRYVSDSIREFFVK